MPPLIDPDKTIRTVLRSIPSISALIDERVYFAVPEQDRPQLPFILMYTVGGRADYSRIGQYEYVLECWANNKFNASELARTLGEELLVMDDGLPTPVDGVRIAGVRLNHLGLPVQGTSWAKRFRVDTSWWLRAA